MRKVQPRRAVDPLKTLQAAAQAPNTTRSYASSLKHFLANGGRIPATEHCVARYLARYASQFALSTLQIRLVAIHRAHVERRLRSPAQGPLVKSTLRAIRRTYGCQQRRVRALVPQDIRGKRLGIPP